MTMFQFILFALALVGVSLIVDAIARVERQLKRLADRVDGWFDMEDGEL